MHLVISPNAILTGCGVILGTITNQGTIATNCGPPSPLLVNPVYAVGVFSFSFESANGFTYIVEYAPAVDALTWNTLTLTNGTGSNITIRDNSATGANRFYRLRVQ